MTIASIEMTTTITDEKKTKFCGELHTIIDLVNTLHRSTRSNEMESEDGSGVLNCNSALVKHIGISLGDSLEKFDEMSTTMTDEQNTEFCGNLLTIICLVNSLQRSIRLAEIDSEDGSATLNSNLALAEHIGISLGDFFEKFEELPVIATAKAVKTARADNRQASPD
jgi:Asp-tRNA(Asn)/Glu-tRNA(Gln) amidotransferase C subunit